MYGVLAIMAILFVTVIYLLAETTNIEMAKPNTFKNVPNLQLVQLANKILASISGPSIAVHYVLITNKKKYERINRKERFFLNEIIL